MAKEKKEFRLPEANDNMHRVYAYLIKQRFIAPEVITHFAKRKLLYEDKKHHNAVFVHKKKMWMLPIAMILHIVFANPSGS